ncbi:MAG: hypothetical protein U5N85_19190 [Arcicella sp.]|nr:hypothetical protein [Arcicella sp.]
MPYSILQYSEFDLATVKKKFGKTLEYLQTGNFKSAEVKKMPNAGFFRAKLDRENRLLFKFVSYQGQKYLLLLELILNHDYEKSRFLKGAEIDENKLIDLLGDANLSSEIFEPLRYVNPKKASVYFLDKFISFDDAQIDILHLPVPLIIIGSAGSGKTALTLERLKILKGNVAYISLSPFLVENAENLYYAQGYENNNQEVSFLSFKDYLQSIRIPEGKEINFRQFEYFFSRYKNTVKIREAYKLFEEFKGVLTGASIEKEYLSRDEYLALGIKQSVFMAEQRSEVYDLFEKYVAYLKSEKLYDSNMVSHQFLSLTSPIYDYVVVDEVQDFTNIQLQVIFKSLKNPVGFVLCGDANQIVHPNFFSWSSLKTMFYHSDLQSDIIRVLHTNYRNSQEVTELANTLLKIKNTRFGSIDKESTHLIDSISSNSGEVEFLEDKEKLKQDLNKRTKSSTQYAVLVMNNEDKAEARKYFETPLIFSIQEAKGLEYENIILVNFISTYEKEFRIITEGVTLDDLNKDLVFGRNRDKSNKELDTFKFYINSLYVAITRAVQNLYLIEKTAKHPMLPLLGLVKAKENTSVKEVQSSLDDWKKEARKLEMQGKKEQSDAINQMIAKRENRILLSEEELETLKKDALNPEHFNNQAKKKLLNYCISNNMLDLIKQLADLKYPDARKYFEKLEREFNVYIQDCISDKIDAQNRFIKLYGVNFNNIKGMNGLITAAEYGSMKSLKFLLENGANRQAKYEDLNVFDWVNKQYILELARVYRAIEDKKKYTPSPLPLKKFPAIYSLLRTNSVQVKVDNRILKIGNHTMEYFLLHFMVSMYKKIIDIKSTNARKRYHGMENEWSKSILAREIQNYEMGLIMDDFLYFLEAMPNEILPQFRRQRQYINSILAKNEIDRNDPYNRKLFKRTTRGVYQLNPELEIIIN